jgi:hypothetical protein
VRNLSKQWLEAIYDKLIDYEDFRKTFLYTLWSQSQQSIVKCNLFYQGKYDRQSNLTLSGHFLKYAIMALYLDPRPTEVESLRNRNQSQQSPRATTMTKGETKFWRLEIGRHFTQECLSTAWQRTEEGEPRKD